MSYHLRLHHALPWLLDHTLKQDQSILNLEEVAQEARMLSERLQACVLDFDSKHE